MLLEALISALFISILLGAANFGLIKINYFANKLSENISSDSEVKNCNIIKVSSDIVIKCDKHLFLRSQNGITLIETMVSLLIGSLILAMSVKESNFIFKEILKRKSYINKLSSFNEWTSITQKSLLDLDYARISNSFRILNSPIKYANESLIELTKPAHSESNGFASVRFFKISRLVIEKIKLQQNTIVNKLCFDKSSEKLPTSFDCFVLSDNLVTEAACEFAITTSLNTANQFCGLIDFTPINKPLLRDSSQGITSELLTKTARSIIPIAEKYLYYLDNQNTLRRIQFRKDSIVESQPVKSDVHPIKISKKFDRPTLSLQLQLIDTDYVKVLSQTASALSDLSLALTK